MPGQTKSAKVITQEKKADRSRSKSTTRPQTQKVAQPEKKATAPAQKKVAKKTEVSPVRETRSKKVAPTKSKPLLSKSVDEAKLLSDSESSDTEVAYKAGDLVAFVDKNDAEEGKMVISIGKVSVSLTIWSVNTITDGSIWSFSEFWYDILGFTWLGRWWHRT